MNLYKPRACISQSMPVASWPHFRHSNNSGRTRRQRIASTSADSVVPDRFTSVVVDLSVCTRHTCTCMEQPVYSHTYYMYECMHVYVWYVYVCTQTRTHIQRTHAHAHMYGYIYLKYINICIRVFQQNEL